MSIRAQADPRCYSLAMFARNLTELAHGPAQVSVCAKGALSYEPGASPQEFRWPRKERRKRVSTVPEMNRAFSADALGTLGPEAMPQACDECCAFGANHISSLPSGYGIFLKTRCVRVGEIRRILVWLIEHFSSATRISSVFLDQLGDEPDVFFR